MQFSVKKKDGPARIGELIVDDKRVVTPNILFIDTDRFKAPNFADICITNNKRLRIKPTIQISDYFVYSKDISKQIYLPEMKQNKKDKKNYYILPGNKEILNNELKENSASFFIISNAFQLFQQPKKFVDFIIELREKIGYEKLIYFPSVGDSVNFSLLSYLGVDFFDSISAILYARNHTLLFSNRKFKRGELYELPCTCPSCNKFKGKISEMSFQEILNHNYFAIINELKQVRNAIKIGDLRDLVETRVKSDPNLTAILRYFDKNNYDFLEKRTPLTSKILVLATTKESLHRPEIKRFQKRIIERFMKPESAKILLLLPCSAKKPYSFSKSHRFYRERLNSSGNPFIVHELIITSPMGLVPRELELIHPASSYDIPVTGIWDEDEKKMIRKLLIEYLKNNKYEKIIAHLPKEIMEFINDILKKPEITCIDSPTSQASLDKLYNSLKKNVRDYEKVKSQVRLKENVLGLASYQFGQKIANELLKDCKIRGKYPYQKIIYNNNQLGMITEDRGLISLTINGAVRLKKSKKYWVEIYDDFILKGSVFAPGIKNVDKEIRIGDEVIIIRKNKLCAVGVAQMNGEEMKKSSYGEAVKVRHRI